MTLSLPLPLDIVGFTALFARVSGFFIVAPIVGSRVVPMRWRVLMCLAVSLLLASVLPEHWRLSQPDGAVGFVYLSVLIGSELLLGIMVSLFVHVMFEMYAFAGHVVGINMGFAFARQVDPTLDVQSSMVSVLMTQLFTIVFVALGGIDLLLRLAAFSVQRLPPGAFAPSAIGLAPMTRITGQIFAVGFQLALPVFCVTLFINIALGLMTRFGEEFQVLMLAFPIRIIVGFFIMSATIPLWVHMAGRLMNRIMRDLAQLLPS